MAKNVDSPTSHFHFNQRDEAESKSRTFCRVCKKEFFGTDPSISRKQAQANAFTHWLRHCRNTFTSELKCTNGVVWVEVNAAKRSEEDRLNDTGPPRWTCPAKICDRKYQTPRSFHEHWNRIHTGIDPSLIDGIVDTPTHRGLEEGGDENENGTPSASGSNRGGGSSSKANGSTATQSKSNAGASSSKPQKRTLTSSKASPKKKQQNQAAEDDEDEIDILTFDEDLSSTSNLNLDEIEKEIQELKTKNSQLNKRIESTEMELAEEKKLSNVLRSKTHSLEVTTFSLRDELDQEKLFSESLKSQAKLSEEISLKEIQSLKEKLMDVNNNHGGSSNGVNGNSVGDEKVTNGEKSFGIDGNRLPDLKALSATAEKNSWDEPQPESQLAFSSSSYSTQPLPNEASSSKDALSPLKRKREEGEGTDQLEPENKMFKPMEPLLQNRGE